MQLQYAASCGILSTALDALSNVQRFVCCQLIEGAVLITEVGLSCILLAMVGAMEILCSFVVEAGTARAESGPLSQC